MSEFMLRFWYDIEVNESFRKKYFSRLNRFKNEGRNNVMKKDWNNVSVDSILNTTDAVNLLTFQCSV
jgi:hypothetical protein